MSTDKKATEASVLLNVGEVDTQLSWWKRMKTNREFQTFWACSMFMITSPTMLILNKVVVKHFTTPLLVILSQNALAVGICLSVLFKFLHFGNRADVITFAKIVPLTYTGVLCTSSIAQQYASLGLQITIRNLGPIITLPIERLFNEPIVADAWTWTSLFVVWIGVVLYVVESLGFAPYHVNHVKAQDPGSFLAGCLLMFGNMMFVIVERLYQRRLLAVTPVDVSKVGMVLINNAVSLVPITLLIFPLGEYKWDSHIKYWTTDYVSPGSHAQTEWYHYVLLFVSGLCGLGVGWTSMNAQMYVTATTMLLITNLNKVLVLIFGMFFLGEPDGPFAISGMLLALGGGVCYAMARRSIGSRQSATASSLAAPADTKSTPILGEGEGKR